MCGIIFVWVLVPHIKFFLKVYNFLNFLRYTPIFLLFLFYYYKLEIFLNIPIMEKVHSSECPFSFLLYVLHDTCNKEVLRSTDIT